MSLFKEHLNEIFEIHILVELFISLVILCLASTRRTTQIENPTIPYPSTATAAATAATTAIKTNGSWKSITTDYG